MYVRIERYASMATPASGTSKPEPSQYSMQAGPTSPTSSLKTNASSTLPATESGHSHSYHPFPAQAARMPSSQPHLPSTQEPPAVTPPDAQRPELSTVASASNVILASTTESWPVAEGFRDRHISASEPRIFPGVVSRHQRRASTAKAEEVDGGGGSGLVMRRKGPSAGPSTSGVGKGTAGANDAVEESSDEEA